MNSVKLIKNILREEVTKIDESMSNNCSSVEGENWKTLYKNLVRNRIIKNGEPMIIVWGPTQTGYYTDNGVNLTKKFLVSTGKNGFSNNVDNKETPIGLMVTSGKFVAPKKYQVLVSRRPINKILGPNVDSNRIDEKGKKHIAEVTTGLLELSGLEQCNKNVKERNIYFHGTNKEKNLGTKSSAGCIRVSNDMILWLTSDNIKIGTKVYVKGD